MAIQLRFNTQVSPQSPTARLDRAMPQRLRRRSDRPLLVMHWVEEPDGRISCYWDVARP
jgi:hypothetical protein